VSLPNAAPVCRALQAAKKEFVDSVNNANNLFYVESSVNSFKLNFFRTGGASQKSKSKRPSEVQSATMKYLKKIEPLAGGVASGFVKVLNEKGKAGISQTTEGDWTAQLKKIITDAINE
jgi:hypothetical protein